MPENNKDNQICSEADLSMFAAYNLTKGSGSILYGSASPHAPCIVEFADDTDKQPDSPLFCTGKYH
eukprot:13386799-Ditylum_brightwellii.AAC.1